MKYFIILFFLLSTYILAENHEVYKNVFWGDLQQILQHHPKVKTQVLNLSAKIEEYGYKKTVYPDPRFGIAYSNVPYNKRFKFELNKDSMSGIEYSLIQPIPFPGRLSLESKITEKEVELERLNLVNTYNEISKDVLNILISYFNEKKLYKVNQEYYDRFKIISQSSQAKYQTGKGTLFDVSNAILTEKKLKETLLTREGILKAQEERLYYYYSIIEKHSLSNPNYEEQMLKYIDLLFKEVEEKDFESLISNSTYFNYAKLISTIEEKKVDLQKFESYPEFEIFLSYMKREKLQNQEHSGEDLMSAGISFRIPIWSTFSNPKAVKSMVYNKEKSKENINEILLNLKTKFKELKIEIETLQSRISHYKNILIPQSEISHQSALNNYTAGKIDFNEFSMTWMQIYEFQQMLYSLEKELYLKKIEYLELSNSILPKIYPIQKEALYENK